MKDRIFEEMRLIGWNLGNNENKDFEEVYNIHKNKMDYLLEEESGTGERRIDLPNWTAYIWNDELANICEFMLDFMECLDRLDRQDKLLKEKESDNNGE